MARLRKIFLRCKKYIKAVNYSFIIVNEGNKVEIPPLDSEKVQVQLLPESEDGDLGSTIVPVLIQQNYRQQWKP